ncbi:hypothetical protein C2E23DRAFT_862495 [Lenzites betulinus]|nr:hypothetical protein C2E23DRAFT_862495 [Lenzites betulinus]
MPATTVSLAPVVSSTSQATNPKKRALADSDTEQRDVKRAKPQDGVAAMEPQKENKDKKKRRKRKRKAPLASAQGVLDAHLPVAPKVTGSPSRSRSLTLAGSSPAPAESDLTQKESRSAMPTAGPSAVPLREPSSSLSSTNKGKERASPDREVVQATQQQEQQHIQQITELEDKVFTKTNLVSQHENLVSAFQQSLSCQICLDLMHKPFALAPCGHAACYQCLVNWFKAPPPDVPANDVLPVLLRRKTCPHCRTVVKERPIEIWTIKDMVATLVKSGLAQALLPLPAMPEDAPANADAWSGIFPPAIRNHRVFPFGQPPELMRELIGCGRVYPGHDALGHDLDDFDEDDGFGHWADPPQWDDDLDEDDEEDDGGEEDIGVWGHFEMFRQLFLPDPLRDGDSDSEYSVESRHDDEEIDFEAERVVVHPAPWVPNRGWNPHLNHDQVIQAPDIPYGHPVSGDEEDEDEEDGYESSFIDDHEDDRPRRHLPWPIVLNHDPVIDLTDLEEAGSVDNAEAADDDDEEVEFVGVGRRRGGLRRGPIVIESDEEDEVDDPAPRNHVEVHAEYYRAEHDGSDEDGDLAGEVAAREYDMYGDDGSVPRGAPRFERYADSEEDGEGSGYDDEYSY